MTMRDTLDAIIEQNPVEPFAEEGLTACLEILGEVSPIARVRTKLKRIADDLRAEDLLQAVWAELKRSASPRIAAAFKAMQTVLNELEDDKVRGLAETYFIGAAKWPWDEQIDRWLAWKSDLQGLCDFLGRMEARGALRTKARDYALLELGELYEELTGDRPNAFTSKPIDSAVTGPFVSFAQAFFLAVLPSKDVPTAHQIRGVMRTKWPAWWANGKKNSKSTEALAIR